MKIKIVKNKYINALFLLMFFSAIMHTLILFCFFIISKDFYALNYFNILDADLFYKDIFNSFSGNIFAFLLVVFIYFLILKTNKHE